MSENTIALGVLALACLVICAVLGTWAVWIYRELRMRYRRWRIRGELVHGSEFVTRWYREAGADAIAPADFLKSPAFRTVKRKTRRP